MKKILLKVLSSVTMFVLVFSSFGINLAQAQEATVEKIVLDVETIEDVVLTENTSNFIAPTGSIRVCKVVVDANGTVLPANSGTTFTIPFVNASYEGPATGTPNDAVFGPDFAVNDRINIPIPGDNAQCVTYSNLPDGRYYYGEEEITGSGEWEAPHYNDQANMTVDSLDDLLGAGEERHFNTDADPQYDNSDGVINLLADQTRTLIVLNQIKNPTPPDESVCDANNQWDVTGSYVWTVGTNNHDVVLSMNSNGTFTGTGGFPAGETPYTNPGQTGLTVTNGIVSGNNISFTITYTGPLDPGATYDLTGTIANNGTISGISISPLPSFNWSMTSGKAEKCPDESVPTTATINATKIVCDSEADLPNWGAGNSTMQQITSNTATRWLAANPNNGCHLEKWNFQWSLDDIGNPGNNNTNTSITNWNNFENTASVPAGTIWFREVADANYIPFTGQNTDQPVSAEFYCGSDVLNYDNWEFIDTVAGETYNCVGFNVPIAPSCNANAQQVIVSDTTTLSNGFPTVALSFIHSWWTANIPGATWIWDVEPLANPAIETIETFTKDFTIVGTPLGATLDIAADNSYSVSVNGNPVGADNGSNFFLADQDNGIVIPASSLLSGLNTITFTVKNFAQAPGTTQEANPAGLLYKLTVNNNECENPPVDGGNQSPTADAGPDQTITLPTNSTSLNGTGTDTDGTIALPYVWTWVSGPSTIDPNDVEDPTITGLVAGTYVFQLTVTDNDSATGTDTVSIIVNPETNGGGTTPQCSDGVDNSDEEDSLIDSADPGCHVGDTLNGVYDPNDNDESNETPAITNTDNNSSNGGSSGSRRRGGSVLGATAPGQVLGAETTCGIYLDKYLQKGRKNDVDAVKKVQKFLNDFLHAGLKEDGKFGPKTDSFVRAFQWSHKEKVLDPWKLTAPTGIVYLTTQTEINNIMCPALMLPIPTNLIPTILNPLFPPKL